MEADGSKLIRWGIAGCCWFLSQILMAQELRYVIMAPEPNSIVPAENLFVSIALDEQKTFVQGQIRVFLNKKPIYPEVKYFQNTLSFLHYELLPNGRNHLRIIFKIHGVSSWQEIEWAFYVNVHSDSISKEQRRNKEYSFSGTITLDNRQQYLAGPGAALRQEPPFTRTASANTRLTLDKVVIPFQMFATSDNRNFIQSRNFIQTGIQTSWLNILAGDLNPTFDRLVLSGVRITGVSGQVKVGSTGVQIVHGRLNRPVEGRLETFDPASGLVPINLVNDSQYVVPGTYQRDITAARLYIGNKKQTWSMAIQGLKAKDNVRSIQYGIAPKDNIVGGAEFNLRIFKRKVFIQSGISISAITNDISSGPLSKVTLDTAFNIKLPFDPMNFEKILVINSSTKPTKISTDFLSYFVTLNWMTSWHHLTADYNRIGAQYFSLSNPFLRNNSENLIIQDRVFIFKRKLTLSGTYQTYNNNLNNLLLSNLKSEVFTGGLTFHLTPRFPSVILQYSLQNRSSTRAVLPSAQVDDHTTIVNGLINQNIVNGKWKTTLRISGFANRRVDDVRPASSSTFYNGMFGIGENIGNKIFLSFDFGKTLLYNYQQQAVSDINAYNANVLYDVIENKLQISLLAGNNRSISHIQPLPQIRNSLILKIRYTIVNGLLIESEGGWQPFDDRNAPFNSFEDGYAYVRLSYDFNYSNRTNLR
jgi:hypothetical protein